MCDWTRDKGIWNTEERPSAWRYARTDRVTAPDGRLESTRRPGPPRGRPAWPMRGRPYRQPRHGAADPAARHPLLPRTVCGLCWNSPLRSRWAVRGCRRLRSPSWPTRARRLDAAPGVGEGYFGWGAPPVVSTVWPVSRTVTLVLVDCAGALLGALPPYEVPTPWWQDASDVVVGA